MLPNEIFLSHSSKDRKFAEGLARMLRAHGLPVWFSRTNIRGAQQWHDEIGAALKRCDWFVVVLSPHSVGSMWVKRELLFALQQDHFENRIVPLLMQPCDHERLSWTLTLRQFVDFTGAFDIGCRDLLRIWGIGFDPGARSLA
ncbi:MAG: toll/interleukin-1 receptor domain-containing protein [Planctomycetes bacterium]|nr:toll/interleukin-1 receptor domain-containing protein [Planctomycetota bacterium]